MSRTFAIGALALLGCTGELRFDDAAVASMDAAAPPGADAGAIDASERDGGPPPPLDAGACAGGLAAGFTSSPIRGLGASDGVHAAATPSGLVVATSGGGVTLTWVGLDGASAGTATVDGNRAWGVAADGSGAAGVLVDRGSDELWLVVVEPGGAERFAHRLLGGVPHDVTENEWFGTGIRAGRVTWTGSQWATYHTVQRLWNDGVAHYGDTLRFFDASGAPAGGGWGWGCSHSMEVRIVQGASGIGPLCVSDCFPGKGVYFSHRTELFEDPSGDCRGRVDTRLGGIAPVAGGFLAAFSTPHGRASRDVALVRVGDDRSVSAPVWVTDAAGDDADVHLAAFAGGALVGWTAGGADRLARVDAAGVLVEGPVDLPAGLARASDFVPLPGGAVAWVTTMGSSLAIAHLRVCE
ncbi:MAG: hypothetical protein KF729_19510 [Sandaracinaceae bacterium]|nr:hypothetical protein [Sandaracinaceae bacterium]